ncbi:MAG: peptide ABC transporter substrate-binding protein [Phycisphaerales bacterium]|nr:peptide ABC transporter substrate-binding protein [Phycisphaerales bacterium]
MWKLLVPVALLVALLIGAVLADRPYPRADFVYIERSDINTIDPHKMSWSHDLRLAGMIHEGLVRTDVFSDDLPKVPAMAESWSLAADGLTWTFKLRDDAKWTNGEPVLASDFVYAWRRGTLPDAAGDYTAMFQLVKGGKAFYDWRENAQRAFAESGGGRARPTEAEALWAETCRKFDEMVAVRATAPRTLVISLERPTPYFLEVLAYEIMAPVYPKLVDQYQSIDPVTGMVRYDSGWTKPGILISNGPFKLVSWRYKREIRLERNELYWNQSAISVDTIALPSVVDGNAAVLAFQTGAADWVSDVNMPFKGELIERREAYLAKHAELVKSLRAQGLDPVEIDRRLPFDEALCVQPMPSFGTYFLNFNCSPRLADGRVNPFADARVRRAFAISFDRDNVARNVRRGGEPAASTMIPPRSIAGYTGPAGPRFAPDPGAIATARALMAEAGFPDGKGFISVEFMFNKEGGHDVIAQAIKRDWEQNLGVSVRLDQRDLKTFRNELKTANYMISRAAWFGDYTDPLTFLDLHRTGDGNNDRKYSSARFDGLLDQAAAETDPQKRLAILSEAERVIVEEDCPIAPVFHYVQVYLFNPHKLSGITPHVRQKQQLYMIDILGDKKGREVPQRMKPAGPLKPTDEAPTAPSPKPIAKTSVPRRASRSRSVSRSCSCSCSFSRSRSCSRSSPRPRSAHASPRRSSSALRGLPC